MRETVYRCAHPDCEAHIRSQAPAPPRGWVLIQERQDDGSIRESDYCGWTCLMRVAAGTDPDEVFEAAL